METRAWELSAFDKKAPEPPAVELTPVAAVISQAAPAIGLPVPEKHCAMAGETPSAVIMPAAAARLRNVPPVSMLLASRRARGCGRRPINRMFGMIEIAPPGVDRARVITPVELAKLCVDSCIRLGRERVRIWLRRSHRRVLGAVLLEQQIGREFR